MQAVTGQSIEVAFVDQAYTGDAPQQAAAQVGIQLIVVKLLRAKQGFVLLPRLARDYERRPDTLKGLHFLAFAGLMFARFVHFLTFYL